MNLPSATYRLQLRNGVDFDAAASFLPHIRDLGASHLYLSPIFIAAPGSTHGYDVTDPTRIDESLGGRAGFDRLACAAQETGIGLILDLVPNHTAFDLTNPWLVDVLRFGRDSRFSRHFDIDWDEGPLVLPWLDQPFEAAVADGNARRNGDILHIGGLDAPLRPDAQADSITALHEAQQWRLTHWTRERDSLTHRRFFNVTGLIGMRVEDPEVFHDMHALVFDMVRAGQVQGLRIDHVDGLADPGAYLRALRQAVPDTPIWVEKILTGDETLCDWPVQGTTGYEAATMIARVLANADGAEKLRLAWHSQTDGKDRFHDALVLAKGDVIRRDLASELRRLITLARRAFDPLRTIDPGDESLREAFIALLIAFPRYRSYFSATETLAGDLDLMSRVADEAAAAMRSREVLDASVAMITTPDNAAQTALQVRFQQVTGALLAKSHEDTAGFRWTPLLYACEVGADPDHPAATAAEAQAWAAAQPGTGLILTSSHDTKRSEDARMRLVAWTHLPDDALALIDVARALPEAAKVPGNVLWYVVQAVLAIWDETDPDLDQRLADHMTKALREADQITSWTHPDDAAESQVQTMLAALIAAWKAEPPGALARLTKLGARLSMAQLGLKLMLPGIPDIYRGCETVHFALTDPDNRHPVDLAHLRGVHEVDGLGGDKARLTRRMLALRADHPDLFAGGAVTIQRHGNGALQIARSDDQNHIVMTINAPGDDQIRVELLPQKQAIEPGIG